MIGSLMSFVVTAAGDRRNSFRWSFWFTPSPPSDGGGIMRFSRIEPPMICLAQNECCKVVLPFVTLRNMRWMAILAFFLVLTGSTLAAGSDEQYLDIYNEI